MAKCFECNSPATQLHHVVPESLGGTKTIPLCDLCHPKAHGETGYWRTRDLIKAKLKERKEQGYRIGGQIPYGKMADGNKRIVDNPEERYWQFVGKYLADQGMHFRAIAALFTARGVPTRGGHGTWRGAIINRAVRRLREELGEHHAPGVWARGKRVRP